MRIRTSRLFLVGALSLAGCASLLGADFDHASKGEGASEAGAAGEDSGDSTCPSERADCDGDGRCETTLASDPDHCGTCETKCGDGLVCAENGCVDACPSNLSKCGRSCVDTQSDEAHCGGCDEPACVAPTNGNAACHGGKCDFSCDPGFERDGTSCTKSATSSPQLAAGYDWTCGIVLDGSLRCWGRGRADGFTGVTLPSGPFTRVTMSDDYGCALRSDKSVACWGQKYGTPTTSPLFDISAGGYTTCGVTDLSDIACWSGGTIPTPSVGYKFKQVSVGSTVPAFVCAITTDDEVKCWGVNSYGQTNAPPGKFTQVSSGQTHACGLTLDRKIRCWGATPTGQSIDGRYGQVENAPSSGEFTQISSGYAHACALRSDGGVVCWGAVNDPRVTKIDYKQVSDTPTHGTFRNVVAGEFHSCATSTSGTVQCWGGTLPLNSPPSDKFL